MTEGMKNPGKWRQRVLDPAERFSEILFGLIMVMSFTGALSATAEGSIRTMLIGALGCNLAWGIIDAVMYVLNNLSTRGHSLATLRAVRNCPHPERARQIIADAVPPVLAEAMTEEEFETLRQRLNRLPEPPARARMRPEDWRGAIGVFLLVFLATFPVTLPFLFFQNPVIALRVSNAIAILMLFGLGAMLGRYTNGRTWQLGIAMVVIGLVLVGLTIALGG